MFWKKTKIHNPDILPDILLDASNHREAFRYEFKPHDTLSIQFLDRTVQLVNISAGGIAFMNSGFIKNQADLVEFDLDIPNYPGNSDIVTKIRILDIDDHNICHCVFEDCSAIQQEIIHKYLLEMQKIELKTRKS